jgi:hypothetical protein
VGEIESKAKVPASSGNNEIVLYQPDESVRLDVMLEKETVWLNRQQLATLFGRDVKTIGKHINNALKEELADIPTVAKFATVQDEGGRLVERQITYYSLDMILSVGYRVKSDHGIKFRIWATGVLREFLLKGHVANQRFEHIERRLGNVEEKVGFFVRTALPPVEGVFCEGEIFDAHEFASRLVRSAKKRVVLVDNYLDETMLSLLAKRRKSASVTIYTARVSKVLQDDLDKHNAQYAPITIEKASGIHDRFLIIDDGVYHIGQGLGKEAVRVFQAGYPAKGYNPKRYQRVGTQKRQNHFKQIALRTLFHSPSSPSCKTNRISL